MRRRRKQLEAEAPEAPATGGDAAEAADGVAGPGVRADGPWDSGERDPGAPGEHLDLGSLVVRPREGTEVRLQVDEASQQVVAVLVVGEDGALELRPYAAPRHEDMWEDVRRAIGADAAARGGTASTVDGPFGPALQLVLNGQDEQGNPVTQQSAVWGIPGPRWLLRVTAFGRPAVEPRDDAPLEQTLRDVVVVRGTGPMPPGEALPMRLPAQVRQAPQPGPSAVPPVGDGQ